MPSSRKSKQTYPSDFSPAYREYRTKWQRSKSRRARLAVLAAYGGVCVCCGESEPAFLEIDHVNNDAKERVARGEPRRGTNLTFWLIKNKFPADFQVLCCNCNRAKAYFGLCPHKID